MLPVYDDISFVSIIKKGGRNRPFVVKLNLEDKIVPYVVKPFTTEHIETRHAVANEVFGSILAKEFDLPTPEPALFRFNEEFSLTLTPEAAQELQTKDNRIHFGCKLLDGAAPFISGMSSNIIKKSFALADLFAFDLLIRNGDRNHNKPNLLIFAHEAWLIDHEFGFSIRPDTIENIGKRIWDLNWYNYHICFSYLKKLKKDKRGTCFETFEEYLRNLNFNVLDEYKIQLEDLGFDMNYFEELKTYFRFVKGNSIIFVNLLKGLIS